MLETSSYTVVGGAARSRAAPPSPVDASGFTPDCTSLNTVDTFYSFLATDLITITFAAGAVVKNPVVFLAVNDQAVREETAVFNFPPSSVCVQGGGIFSGGTLFIDGSGTRTFYGRQFFPSYLNGAAVAFVGEYTELLIGPPSFAGLMILSVGVSV